MYHHSLHILLCCTDTLLESSLRRAAPHPGFTHVITAACGPFCSPAPAALPGLAEADIVLLDAENIAELPALRKAAKQEALFVLGWWLSRREKTTPT